MGFLKVVESSKNKQLVKPSERLEHSLRSYKIGVTVRSVVKTAIAKQYWLQLHPGMRISHLRTLSDEISLILGAKSSVRIYPDFKHGVVIIEVPYAGKNRTFHTFEEVIYQCGEFADTTQQLPLLFGTDAKSEGYVVDLQELPHLLVAGRTGSGKSVFLRSVINSLLMASEQRDIKLILIDPKSVEFISYNKLPQLLGEVFTDVASVSAALDYLIGVMEKRYTLLAQFGCMNTIEFNERSEESLPFIVTIIDEFADLFMQDKGITQLVVRLAQKGRAAGIHLIIATQRPSSNVVDGLIKANFSARVAFQVSSMMESKIVLDEPGAERLMDKGDMLFSFGSEMVRLQGVYADRAISQKLTIAC